MIGRDDADDLLHLRFDLDPDGGQLRIPLDRLRLLALGGFFLPRLFLLGHDGAIPARVHWTRTASVSERSRRSSYISSGATGRPSLMRLATIANRPSASSWRPGCMADGVPSP